MDTHILELGIVILGASYLVAPILLLWHIGILWPLLVVIGVSVAGHLAE